MPLVIVHPAGTFVNGFFVCFRTFYCKNQVFSHKMSRHAVRVTGRHCYYRFPYI